MSASPAPLAERISDLPLPDSDSGSPAPNFLVTIIRRWPLVLLGVMTGVILGLAYYAQASPQFESRAQILVIKRGIGTSGESSRFAYMEDYVSTQQTLIKSKKVMGAAALRLRDLRLQNPLPDDLNLRTETLILNVTIARDKEGGASVIGSNVLNLAYRSGDATDCKRILDTIISAYQEELKSVYDQQTTDEINTQSAILIRNEQQKKATMNSLKINEEQMLRITPERQSDITQRLSQVLFQNSSIEIRLYELKNAIERMESAPNDPRARRAIMADVAGSFQIDRTGYIPSMDDPNSPIQNLDMAILRLKQFEERKGPNHPDIIDLKNTIDYLKNRTGDATADGTSDKFDAFMALKARLRSMHGTSEQRKKELDAEVKEINTKMSQLASLVSEGMILRKELEGRDNDTRIIQDKLNRLEATKNSGGYNAAAISEPSDGAKVAPRLIQSVLLFSFLGTVMGLGLAFAFELTDKSFRSPAEIRRRLGLPVVGHIPPIRTDLPMDNPALKGTEPDMEPVIVTHLRPKSIEAEAYRGVRTQLYFSTQGAGHQVIQVTSPNPGDGKSTLAANLAVSIAQSGKRVVLIDCDFRKPRVHKIFHIDKPDVGLASVINGDCELGAAIRTISIENLSILPCGPRPQNPAELLTSPEFQTVIDQLRAQFDFVIIDTPPVLAVSDPAVVAPRVDGVLLVFRMTKKARPTAERAREQLAALGANVLGVIVNGTGRSKEDGYGYGYGYNYGYGYQYQYQYEYEYADNYTDDGLDSPSSYGDLERPELPPARDEK